MPTPAAAAIATWNIDPTHSVAEFKIKHMMISNVKGTFPKVSGALTLDESSLTRSHVEAVIDVSSINTGDAQRDGHLKSPDFFDIEKFPSMSFKSSSIAQVGDGLLTVSGALTIRDIDDDVLVDKEHPWASRKPSKRALQLAFYEGRLTISERSGMLKTYQLMARHFGWDQPPHQPPKPASAREIIVYLLDRALRAQGIVSLDSICHLDAPRKAQIQRLIEARVRRGELVPVVLEAAGKQQHWAEPATLENAGGTAFDLVHILSPFDPLVIQRKRTQLFFGYEHRFEAYIPKEKRRFGYFALPVLVGDDIVAALDLKTDRQRRKLLMQKWNWVGEGAARGARKELKRRIEEELHRFERFQLAE